MIKIDPDLKKASEIVKETGIGRTTLWRLASKEKIKFEIIFGTKVYSLREVKQHLKSFRGAKT